MYLYNGRYEGMRDEWGDVYCDNANLRIQRYEKIIVITELDNALKTGRYCPTYEFKWECEDDASIAYEAILKPDIINNFRDIAEYDFASIPHFIEVNLYYSKGKNTFSPFAKVKKQDFSTKITNIKIVKAILAGQIRYVILTYEGSDNYYYDLKNKVNYCKQLDLLEFAREFLNTSLSYRYEKIGNLLRIVWNGWESREKSYLAYLNE